MLTYFAITGEVRALHAVATLNGWWDDDAGGWVLVPGLMVIGGLQAWLLWALLRMPPLTVHRGLRQALIALALCDTLLWTVLMELPELLVGLVYLGLLVVIAILLPGVFAEWPVQVRNVLVALGLIGLPMSPPMGVVLIVWWGLMLMLQFSDGRWSAATLVAGLVAMGTHLTGLLVPMPPELLVEGDPHWAAYEVLLDASVVADALWMALTARELTTLSPLEPVVTPRRSRSLAPRPAFRVAA
ncbi:hypothetical protein FDA94_12020 [Herbidospora galbida]|uniref:Uncharacterized protein n=1 Tax=Herbidospora galbida TaxID=2575442 RepID=A0A4U3MHI7_9ACTN|nr:hypothetical protein [Herbidospora galbida]TKK88805.1 hypothetical protein FDA94_12020 [Herbidospora galbida]